MSLVPFVCVSCSSLPDHHWLPVNGGSGAVEEGAQGGIADADAGDAAGKGFLRAQQFFAHATLRVPEGLVDPGGGYVAQEGCGIIDAGEQAGNVGEDDQRVGVQGGGNGCCRAVAIDVEPLTASSEGERGQHGGIAPIKEQVQQGSIHLDNAPCVVIANNLDTATGQDGAHGGFAPRHQHATIDTLRPSALTPWLCSSATSSVLICPATAIT